MKHTTTEEAAHSHGRRSCVTHVRLHRSAQEIDTIAFIAGAEWHKEQIKEVFKELMPILKEAFSVCLNEGQDDVVERAESFIDQLQLNE